MIKVLVEKKTKSFMKIIQTASRRRFFNDFFQYFNTDKHNCVAPQ